MGYRYTPLAQRRGEGGGAFERGERMNAFEEGTLITTSFIISVLEHFVLRLSAPLRAGARLP